MHSAVCDSCGTDCQVPFKPTGGKPIKCDACFSKDRPSSPGRDRGRSGDRRGDRRDNRRDGRKTMGEGRSEHYDMEFQKINEKLDKILRKLTPVHTRDGVKKIEDMEPEPDSEEL